MPKRKVVNSRLRQYSPKFEELRHWVALSASVMHFPNVSYFVRFYRRLSGGGTGAPLGWRKERHRARRAHIRGYFVRVASGTVTFIRLPLNFHILNKRMPILHV